MSKSAKFILAIAAQVLVIVIIVIYKSAILYSGTEILLELQPVDPRDLLRGDYVTVNYTISTVSYYNYDNNYNNDRIPGSSNSLVAPYPVNQKAIHNGDTVYVPLYKVGKYWQLSGTVTKDKPDSKAAGYECTSNSLYYKGGCDSFNSSQYVYLEGTVTSGGVSDNNSNSSSYNLHVTYGIESYFIPEGKGQNLNTRSTTNNYARVAVSSDGKAVLKQLYINDKPWP